MLTSRPSTARAVCWSVPAALLVWVGACAKTPPQSSPASGIVTVGVTSRGPGVERMAFGVSIEPGGIDGSVKGDVGIFTAHNVPAGSHVVRLKDLPSGCQVEGDAERTISVSPHGSTALRFVVVCT